MLCVFPKRLQVHILVFGSLLFMFCNLELLTYICWQIFLRTEEQPDVWAQSLLILVIIVNNHILIINNLTGSLRRIVCLADTEFVTSQRLFSSLIFGLIYALQTSPQLIATPQERSFKEIEAFSWNLWHKSKVAYFFLREILLLKDTSNTFMKARGGTFNAVEIARGHH